MNNMGKRVTVMIDDDLDEKLRLIQTKMIKESQAYVSFSKTINVELRNATNSF